MERTWGINNQGRQNWKLTRVFSPDETNDDTMDININKQMATSIIKGHFGGGVNYSYKTYRNGMTIFATASRSTAEAIVQKKKDDA